MYQVPAGTGAPTTTGPSVARSVRPSRIRTGAAGAFGARTAPLTTCSIVSGTAERCGNTTSTHAMYVVVGEIVTEVVPAPRSLTPSASVPTRSGVTSTRPVVLGTNAEVAASCSSIRSTRTGAGATLVRTSS
jgi:hypothetical protein